MKKILLIILCLCTLLCASTLFVACDDESASSSSSSLPPASSSSSSSSSSSPSGPEPAEGITDATGCYVYEVVDENARILKYIGTATVVIVPTELDGYPVTEIGEKAFAKCTSVTDITIPENVIVIGYAAFSNCTSLQNLTIPFVGGSRKEPSDPYQYPLGYMFGEVGDSAGISTEQTFVGSNADDQITTEYCIPLSLETVTVTGGDILMGAFENCYSLKQLILGDSVTSIGKSAASECVFLENVRFGENSQLTSIGADAFTCCYALVSIELPDCVRTIGDYAFSGCTDLQSVSLPASIESIGDSAFSWCGVLENFYIRGDLSRWFGVELDGVFASPMMDAENIYLNGEPLIELTVPAGVTVIKTYTFNSCDTLTKITIPSHVECIEEWAFANCFALENVFFENPDGWYLGGNPVDPSTLSDPEAAAQFIKDSYRSALVRN